MTPERKAVWESIDAALAEVNTSQAGADVWATIIAEVWCDGSQPSAWALEQYRAARAANSRARAAYAEAVALLDATPPSYHGQSEAPAKPEEA